MKDALVVFNYNSGRKQAIFHKKILHKFLLKRCNKFKFINIDEFNDSIIDDYDTIFAVGGDGTINQVAKSIAGSDKTLAIIPSGTANLLAAKLGIPANLKKCLKIIDKNYIKQIDMLKINDIPCFLRFGLGYDSDIICKTPQSLKNDFGYFAYVIAGIIFALRLKPKTYEITYDNNTRRITATCIIVAKAPNMYKNIVSVGKKSELDDGYFDIFILKTKNPIAFFYEFLRILLNIKSNNSRARYMKVKTLFMKNYWTVCHIDGEKIRLKDDIYINLVNQSLNVYCKTV
ncbi:MAG: diacylglycerol kinase family protein [Candidatus Gastranaerophilaceae bacterium]|nr:diacylglycerol kinase family protein [Candidatus Gastranaerophilaceae bacterium]